MFDNVVRVVRHILDVKKKLIFLRNLDSNGYSDKSESEGIKGCYGCDEGLEITILGGVVVVMEFEHDDTLLWHMCLGHMSERGMRELHKRNLLVEIKLCKLDLCKYCVMEKQCRVKFKTATPNNC